MNKFKFSYYITLRFINLFLTKASPTPLDVEHLHFFYKNKFATRSRRTSSRSRHDTLTAQILAKSFVDIDFRILVVDVGKMAYCVLSKNSRSKNCISWFSIHQEYRKPLQCALRCCWLGNDKRESQKCIKILARNQSQSFA